LLYIRGLLLKGEGKEKERRGEKEEEGEGKERKRMEKKRGRTTLRKFLATPLFIYNLTAGFY